LIEKGDIKNATKLLGRDYSFVGVPFKEKGVGKTLGFPTVNLCVNSDKLLPKGVYTSFISQGSRKYFSLTNVGMRSTFNVGDRIVPETHILGFKSVWKKLQTKVVLLKKIRNEKRFESIEALRNQISKDVSVALRFFKGRTAR
jgi:riboflavin kinase/FMN adenylyltransferase